MVNSAQFSPPQADGIVVQRVLMVDDEPRVVEALRRSLHARYNVFTATSGPQGLHMVQAAIDSGRPFPVVVSDMMMPGMNGAEFLRLTRQLDADAVTMVLSGQADLASTVSAVNDGGLFRFLTKPCDNADLTSAIDAALRQHQLVQSERDLLERTVRGSVEVLTEVLALASPAAFGRAARVSSMVARVSTVLGMPVGWEVGVAAMLCQIGCIAVPEHILHRLEDGSALSGAELEVYRSHPRLAADLLNRIPRLEAVAAWVRTQPTAITDSPRVPLEGPAAVFHAVMALLVGVEAGVAPRRVVHAMSLWDRYPADVLAAVLEVSEELAPTGEVQALPASEVAAGMTLAGDVLTSSGMMLFGKGERVTPTLVVRLANFGRFVGIQEPILVIVPEEQAAVPA